MRAVQLLGEPAAGLHTVRVQRLNAHHDERVDADPLVVLGLEHRGVVRMPAQPASVSGVDCEMLADSCHCRKAARLEQVAHEPVEPGWERQQHGHTPVVARRLQLLRPSDRCILMVAVVVNAHTSICLFLSGDCDSH